MDGFDEIKNDYIQTFINDIEDFSEQYPETKVIITSRPDSGIERSKYFRVYKLAPLSSRDHLGILKKLSVEPEQCKLILEAIRSSSTQINSLLTTPLMLTLLVIVYRAHQKVPEQFSEFYENLFQTLLMRHDKSKPGYTRERKAPVNEKTLQEIFETFCFIASRDGSTSMTFNTIHEYAEQAIKIVDTPCKSDEFISDVSKIACLIIEEGLEYHFIHKSVREFHTANFIKNRSDDFAFQFYEKLLFDKRNWFEWRQELKFLSQIDTYRYSKFFIIPHIENFFKQIEIDLDNFENSLKNLTLEKSLKKSMVEIQLDLSLDSIIYDSHIILDIPNPLNRISELIFKNLLDKDYKFTKSQIDKIKKYEENNYSFKIYMIDCVKALNLSEKSLNLFKDDMKNIFKIYTQATAYVNNEENKLDMIKL